MKKARQLSGLFFTYFYTKFTGSVHHTNYAFNSDT